MSSVRTVFISYSHDSELHKARVLALSNRLRDEGVDCVVDQYESSPPEGWPKWMVHHIMKSDFVLTVCTETYTRRVMGREEPGRGMGAIWEGGLITQAIYEAGGKNDRFIPIFFEAADSRYIPSFLQGATHYLLEEESGYDRLYRRLTEQPAVAKPPLGAVRKLPPDTGPDLLELQLGRPVPSGIEQDWRSLVLFVPERDGAFLARSVRIETGEAYPFGGGPSSITLELEADDAATSARLAGLRGASASVGISYSTTAFSGTVDTVRQVMEGGHERWRVILQPHDTNYGAGLSDIAFESYTADDIAGMRARRILLNEPIPEHGSSSSGRINAAMLEALVQGTSGALQVKESPLPEVFASYHNDIPLFLAAARLYSVLCLKLSGTVEHVIRLDVEMEGASRLRVAFEGDRFNPYVNAEPTRITVTGVMDLTEPQAPAVAH